MDCPVNKSMWKKRSESFRCQGKDVYHCLVKDGGTSVKEKCIEKLRLIEGHCPIFNEQGYIHWGQCNSAGCPNTTYLSNEVYNYPVCLEKKSMTFINSNEIGNFKEPNVFSNNHIGVKIGLFTGFVMTVILVTLGVAVCYWKSRNKDIEDPFEDVEETKPLTEPEDNHAVLTVLKDLQKTDILIIYGKLGNGVSYTGKTVIQKYASQNSEWDYKHLNYLDDLDSSLTERKIVFIDGWFGIWNYNPSEKKDVKRVLETVQQKMLSIKHCKLVIGLRTDVFEIYKSTFKDAGKVKSYLDLDSLRLDTHDEIERHLKKALSSTKCKRRNCECKHLNLKDIDQNYDDIGAHLKINILTTHHELIHGFLKSGNLLHALVSHFNELRGRNKTLYGCLMYIVAKGKYRVGESIDHKVMEYCNIDAVLQIVRPCDFGDCEDKTKFCVKADNEAINYFYKHIVKSDKRLEESLKDHPLVRYAVGTSV